jgi:hypothetical protein
VTGKTTSPGMSLSNQILKKMNCIIIDDEEHCIKTLTSLLETNPLISVSSVFQKMKKLRTFADYENHHP